MHARWVGADERVRVKALAVASEPEMFWAGGGAKPVIEAIPVPAPLGRLTEPVTPNLSLNGPSGQSLNEEYLDALGLCRGDVWLCHVYPYACMNPGQEKAIKREYLPLMNEYDLPWPSLRRAPRCSPGRGRVEEIWDELVQSRADVVVTLGDRPLEWFFRHLEPTCRRISDFGDEADNYGRIHSFTIRGRQLESLPLIHPRQACKLGPSSPKWHKRHQMWRKEVAVGLVL